MSTFPLVSALDVLRDQLNLYFAQVLQIAHDTVILAPMINPDGSQPVEIADRLVLSVVNIVQDAALRNVSSVHDFSLRQGLTHLTVHVLIASNFHDYRSGLQAISSVMTYLQSHSVFSQVEMPMMDAAIDRMTLDLVTLGYSELCSMWTAMGANYRPSLVYTMRIAARSPEEFPHQVKVVTIQ